MKLNYRDKVILGIILAVFIIIGGYVAFIKPKRANIKDNEDKRTEVEDEKDRIERRIATATGLKNDIDEAFNNAEKLGKIFVTKSDIDKTTLLDKFMQSYANDCEVRVTELKVDDTAANALSYYYKPYSEVATSLRESADINGTFEKQIEEDRKETDTIEGRNVETIMSTRYGLEVIGEKQNLWKYMDKIAETDSAILITSIDFEEYDEDEDEKEQKPAAQNNNNNNANNQQNQNQNNDEDEKRKNIEDDTVLKSSIVIQLYSIYNMEKPVTE